MNIPKGWRNANVTLVSVDKLLLAVSVYHAESLSGFLACGDVDPLHVPDDERLPLTVPVYINGLEKFYQVGAIYNEGGTRCVVLRLSYQPDVDVYLGDEDMSLVDEIVIEVARIGNKQGLVPRQRLRTHLEKDLKVLGTVTVSTE